MLWKGHCRWVFAKHTCVLGVLQVQTIPLVIVYSEFFCSRKKTIKLLIVEIMVTVQLLLQDSCSKIQRLLAGRDRKL